MSIQSQTDWLAAQQYMQDFDGSLFHHHEGWVLDDGTQVDDLPATVAGCSGGGSGNSQKGYDGAIESGNPVAGSEQDIAEANKLSMESYLLNSIFTHKSCRYAKECVLNGFASEAAVSALSDARLIMFSERNSEAFNGPLDTPNQDDYDTWVGEAALIGDNAAHDNGWIRWNRHLDGANYLYFDGHVKWLRWSSARKDQFPDHVVRSPIAGTPN